MNDEQLEKLLGNKREKSSRLWLIDDDSTKPIYLENNFPKYDRSRMMQYRLCNHPSEEYQAKHPQKREMDGQISIFDFMEEDADGINRPDHESNK